MSHSPYLYIGLMSGTSLDGVDGVLVDLHDERQPRVMAHHQISFPDSLRSKLLELCSPSENEIEKIAIAEPLLAKLYSDVVIALLDKSNTTTSDVIAIACHGQTIRHLPEKNYTLQINQPYLLSKTTGIKVVYDFRRNDMAYGGQGAPLAPAFHQSVFRSNEKSRIALNLGGIANITWLPKQSGEIFGFDTGPANVLMDFWCLQHLNKAYDDKGQWARSGKIQQALLQQWMSHPYFSEPIPKSTGRELFGPQWLQEQDLSAFSNEDIQATLAEFTVESVAAGIKLIAHNGTADELIVCGGGAFNDFLLERLQHRLGTIAVKSSSDYGIDPSHIECLAFAWMAKQRIENKPGNCPTVTGASDAVALGVIVE